MDEGGGITVRLRMVSEESPAVVVPVGVIIEPPSRSSSPPPSFGLSWREKLRMVSGKGLRRGGVMWRDYWI